MKYQLLHNLGTDDAVHLNKHYGASLPLDKEKLKAGEVIELPERAFDFLVQVKGYANLFATPSKVTGEAKKPELTAPAK